MMHGSGLFLRRDAIGWSQRMAARSQRHSPRQPPYLPPPRPASVRCAAGCTARRPCAKPHHYVYGPYAEPVLRIQPGDVVVVETQDAFGGAVKTEDDLPSEGAQHALRQPAERPDRGRGAEKGDVLAVRSSTILPRGPQPAGTTALIPNSAGWSARAHRDAERAARRAGQEDGGDARGREVLRPHHPALRALHRHAGRQPRDRGGQLAPARLLGRQHGPAGRGAGAVAYFPVQHEDAHFSSATATGGRATASCAAWRSRWRRRWWCRST
jgi:hypothetical protein